MLKPRKRLVKTRLKEDKLLIMTAQAQTFYQANRQRIRYLVAGLAVVVIAAGVYNWSKSSAENSAALESLQAMEAYQSGQLDEALTKCKTIMEDYSGTRSEAQAMFITARVHQQRAEWEEAADYFKRVLDDHGGEPYFAFGARTALGTIAAGQSDWGTAGDWFNQAALKNPDHFNAPEALVQAGKAFRRAGKLAEAKQTLRRVLNDYPKSRAVGDARTELEEIEFME